MLENKSKNQNSEKSVLDHCFNSVMEQTLDPFLKIEIKILVHS